MTIEAALAALYVLHGLSTALLTIALVRLHRRPEANVRALRTRVAELEIDHEKHVERLRSAVGRLDRSRRNEKPVEPSDESEPTGALPKKPGETDAQWKARARAALAAGNLKH